MKRSIYNPFKFEMSEFNKPKIYKLEIPESELLELSKVSENKNGIIWFTKDYLERRGWKDNFINLTHNIVSRKNFEFKIRIYIFDELL